MTGITPRISETVLAQERLNEEPNTTTDTSSVVVVGPSVREAYRRLFRWVAVTDMLSLALAFLVSSWIFRGEFIPERDLLIAVVIGLPIVGLAVFNSFHLYEPYRYTPAEEFRRILLAVSLSAAGLSMLAFWSQSIFGRGLVAAAWGFAILFTLLSRRLWHMWIGRQRANGRLAFPTIIVGTNAEARRLADSMERPGFGFRAIGFLTTEASAGTEDLPVLGDLGELRDVIRASGAECVFVASTAVTPDELKPVAKAIRLEGVEVRVTATLPEVLSSRLTVQPLGGITALSLRPARLSGSQVVAKFAFDILLSSVALVLLSPLLAVVAAAVKLTSPGPVLYKQRRVGLRGRPFTMLKFRTMRVGADQEVEQLRAANGVTDVMFKMRNDPRVTRVGRWLRKLSIDELPQLFNVLRGDMSLVGPRPPLPEEVTKYEDWHFDRLEVPPGITGLWQVSGRSEIAFDDACRLDLFYIENWSLTYDLYILAKTIPVLVTNRGAY